MSVKISTMEVNNFRLLKDLKCDLESDLSIVVGKNNTGKTSILTVLDKFLNPSEKNLFTISDLNIDLKDRLLNILSGQEELSEENTYEQIAIVPRQHYVDQ